MALELNQGALHELLELNYQHRLNRAVDCMVLKELRSAKGICPS